MWCYLYLLALAACWPKVVDDSDLVSIDYEYKLADWTVVEQWSKDITIWDAWDFEWLEPLVRGAKQGAEFEWNINWKDLYGAEYDSNMVQAYPNIILTEVLGVSEPKIWTEVFVDSFWDWVITSVEKDSDDYDIYVVEFNDPKTYSELSYLIKVTDIEKR